MSMTHPRSRFRSGETLSYHSEISSKGLGDAAGNMVIEAQEPAPKSC